MSTAMPKDSIVSKATLDAALGESQAHRTPWSRDEKNLLAVALGVILGWAGVAFVFGWPAFLATALLMVGVMGIILIRLTV